MQDTLTHSQLQGDTSTPLVDGTIGQAFDDCAAAHPDHPGLVVRHQGIRWSYGEYRQQVDRLAAGFLAIGIKTGDRVGIWAPNCAEWCLTQFATAKIGAIMVCINPAYRLYELEYALQKVQCKALVTAESFRGSDYIGMLEQLAPELRDCEPGQLHASRLPHLTTVISTGASTRRGLYRFADVQDMGGEQDRAHLAAVAARLQPDDAINIQFTSGTTGSPKGATLTHRNILNNGKIVGDSMRLTADDRLCIPVPLYHCFGMVMGNLACVTHGATAVFPADAFDPELTLRAVEEERCTALHGVPTMFIAELDLPDFATYDLSSLRTGIMAGANCPTEIMQRVMQRMHMTEVLIAYGQTETSPVNHITTVDDPVEKRVSSVGRPAPHCEIRIIDESGTVVPVGNMGEICVRGYGVMKGYWDDDERTAETIDESGWLHSGDIGMMSADGYTQVTGRIKDMIIRGGENIYPREVEEFLYTHPGVQDVQVFGIPDSRYGEQVCAWIMPRADVTLEESDIIDFCRDQITHFKIPRHIRFVEEFPMTVTGKVQKFIMREQMADALQQGES